MILELFFAILLFFGIIYIYIAKKISSSSNNLEDYFLSKRDLGVLSLMLTLLATQLGGGALLGAADEAYSNGWSVIFYPLGMSVGLMILGVGFGRKFKKLNLNTIAELFEKVYGSIILRKTVSILSIITLFFILASQGIALRKFFISIGWDSFILFFVFWGVVILYTSMGGFKGVVYTDIIQMLFVLVVLILVFFSNKSDCYIGNIREISFKNVSWIGWFFMPLLFMCIEQDMGQRCFAAKNRKTVSISAIISSIILFLCSLFAIYLGVLAKKLNLNIENRGVLMTVVSYITNPAITTIFAVAILLVIISTADSLLCSISSNINYDFSFKIKKLFFNKNRTIFLPQMITFIVGIFSMLFSCFFDNVLFLLIFSYELSVSILFVSVFIGLFFEKISSYAAIYSMILGAISFVVFRIFKTAIPKEILNIAFSFLGFLIGQKVYEVKMKKINV